MAPSISPLDLSALPTLVCAMASLLNPNGYHLHAHNLAFLRSGYLTGLLAEYRSPDFHSEQTRGFLVWLAVVFFTLALRRPRVPAGGAVLLCSWVYFALYAVRNIPLPPSYVTPRSWQTNSMAP